MNELRVMEQEKSVLRWGGLGGTLFIVVFAVVIAFVGPDPAEPEGYPDIRAARTIENGLYLVVFVLWVTHFLALYRALRGTSLAPPFPGVAWELWVSACSRPEPCRTSLPPGSPTSITLPERPPRIRRPLPSRSRRSRAYSTRCSSWGSSSCR
jgi:hypothetical protein